MHKLLAFCGAVLFLGMTTQLSAQREELEYGIKAGVNMSQLKGPSETDSEGNSLESFTLGFRIQAGAFIRYEFTDRLGIWGEFLYAQKGGPYKYEGPSFDPLTDSVGTRTTTLNTSLNYLEMPVTLFYEIIPNRLEFNLGPSAGVLVGANAVGNTKYTDPTVDGDIEYDLDYRYFKDVAGGVRSGGTRLVNIDGDNIAIPTLLGAYYSNTNAETEEFGNYFKIYDIGLNAGFTYRTSGSLRLGFRLNYGLVDITTNGYDVSKQTVATPRADFDRNIGYQFWLGFGF